MKIRTASDLQDLLDRDFSWRVKEISDLRSFLHKSTVSHTKTILRASVALLYAHWEGFIKNTSQWYLEFVSNQGLKYQELKTCFIIFGLKKELELITSSKKHTKNIKAIDFLLSELGNKAKLSFRDAVDTESNLSSVVFQNIAASIGIDITRYETKFHLIDNSLLNRRNRIAHGEFLEIDAKEFNTLSDEIIELMRGYKTDIENSLAIKSYKSP